MVAKRFMYVCLGVLALAASFAIGAETVRAQATGGPEVAVLSGVLNNFETIPLPHYADGTEALESECRWIVSTHIQHNEAGSSGAFMSYTAGRTVVVSQCLGQTYCLETIPGSANYMVVAVRGQQPTATRRMSLGDVKLRWR